MPVNMRKVLRSPHTGNASLTCKKAFPLRSTRKRASYNKLTNDGYLIIKKSVDRKMPCYTTLVIKKDFQLTRILLFFVHWKI
jgi:hypothetical protein